MPNLRSHDMLFSLVVNIHYSHLKGLCKYSPVVLFCIYIYIYFVGSLDYPAQTGHTDWQEEANQKVMFGNCLLIKWNLINIKHMILDEKEIEGSAWGLNHSVAVGSIYKLICFSNSMR